MKNTQCLIAMAAIAISAGMPAMGADLVFLLGGQSNMLGEGITEELPPPYDQPQSAVQFWDNAAWGDLRGGFGYVPTPYRSTRWDYHPFQNGRAVGKARFYLGVIGG